MFRISAALLSIAAGLLIILGYGILSGYGASGKERPAETSPCNGSISDFNGKVDNLQVYVTAYTTCVNLMSSADQCYQQFMRLRDAQERALNSQHAFLAACAIRR